MTNDPIASMNCLQCSIAFDRLLTTVSKLHIGHGVVRISAEMVGILLNSSSPRVNFYDLHLSLRFVLSGRRRRNSKKFSLRYSELLLEAISAEADGRSYE